MFRAWDKINREMISWRRLLNGHNLRNVFMRPEMCGLKLMQSTGLKDKNGVGIFEGDIVSVENHPFQKTKNSAAGIEIEGEYPVAWNDYDLTWCAGNLLLSKLKPYIAVKGNIYENPELMEESK
nr:YopX family protein [Enterococcus pallens]